MLSNAIPSQGLSSDVQHMPDLTSIFDLTPILKLYSRRRQYLLRQQAAGDRARRGCSAVQEQQLRRLLHRAAQTRFGREHGFSSLKSVEDYQRAVPLRRYEDFWSEYWSAAFPHLENCSWPGKIAYFPVTSGTTSGATKYIPLTKEMQQSNNKAALDLLVHHLSNRPLSRIFAGKSFVLGGSTALVKEADGVWSGDLSGIAASTLPVWARPYYYPPRKLALLSNWEEKIDVLARGSLQENIRSLGGVPSWMLILFNRLFELCPQAEGRLNRVYPQLELLTHGGVNFAPYQNQFTELLDGSSAELREVYPASEGFIASADRGYGDGLRLNLDHGIFFEFVPVEELDSQAPTRHWVETIELDRNYAVVLTTCAGLWSYIIGDTVKFVDRTPPRLLITGRTSYFLSAFGEHLICEEIEDAVAAAAGSCSVTDYSVGALFPQNSAELGGHLYIVEFSGPAPAGAALDTFAATLDRQLCERNEDYKAHRAEGFGLRAPEVLPVPSGMFAAWMKNRGKLGGQNKVPRIISDPELFDGLRHFAEQFRASQAK